MTLACPRCKAPLAGRLECSKCGAAYQAVDGVPILLSEELTEQHLHQREYFDAEFAGYEEYAVENWRLSYIERIFGALGVLDGQGPYLDVGVGGSGATVIEAARRGVEAVGCDLSVEGVLAARRFVEREKVEQTAELVVCAAEALPFPDEQFGSASAVALLEHLDDDEAAVGELARVVAPGGRVWITVPHAYRYIPPPVWPLYWWHDRRIGHKRHYDEQRLVDLFARHEFDHVRTYFSGHPVKFLQAGLSLVLPAMRRPESGLWWSLERRDRAKESRRLGAVQLNTVFRRR